MKKQHTKGEWDWGVNGHDKHSEYYIYSKTPREDGTTAICSVIDYRESKERSEEDYANAKLIAAASRLLEALKTMVNTYAPYGKSDDKRSIQERTQEACRFAEAAISKATS